MENICCVLMQDYLLINWLTQLNMPIYGLKQTCKFQEGDHGWSKMDQIHVLGDSVGLFDILNIVNKKNE